MAVFVIGDLSVNYFVSFDPVGFFFSSRRRHTRFDCDWSSDVCSSDLVIPIGNTAAKQDVVVARALRRQSSATLDAAKQRVALEVRNAIAVLESAEQRIEAAQATRAAAEVQLQAERDRFEAGTTNMFFILTRQNDLAAAQLAETVAIADQRKAETELARAMGTILEERGIEMER